MSTLRVDSIELGERHRQDMGDIDSLARSIVEVGLLHPVVVTPELKLIAGQRRLEAVKQLGWEEIPVTVIDLEEVIRGEWAENAERKAFTPSEAVAIGKIIEERERPRALQRKSIGGQLKGEASSNLPDVGLTHEKAARAVGMGASRYQRAKAVVEAAAADPSLAPIADEMDRTGLVQPAFDKVKQIRQLREAESPRTRVAVATRREHIIRLGNDRHSVDAIALKVGVGSETVSKVLKEEGIELVSERIGSLHKPKVNETMEGLVNQAVPAENAVSLVLADWESLDRAQFQRWSEELRSAIRTLSRLERKLH